MKRIKLPKGWYRGKPRANTAFYATSRECLVKEGVVTIFGYAQTIKGKLCKYEIWGNYIDCSDMIWKREIA